MVDPSRPRSSLRFLDLQVYVLAFISAQYEVTTETTLVFPFFSKLVDLDVYLNPSIDPTLTPSLVFDNGHCIHTRLAPYPEASVLRGF